MPVAAGVRIEQMLPNKHAKKVARPKALSRSIKVGSSVRVKSDVRDPDDHTRSLGGWQGRVLGLDGDMVSLAWDSLTLKAMPNDMIEKCEAEGWDWSEMRLGLEDVEPAEARDTPAAVVRAKKALGDGYAWVWLGEEGRRIGRVLRHTTPHDIMAQLGAWRAYLAQTLTFPFAAVVSENQDRGPLKHGDHVKVIGLNDLIENMYGLIADLRVGHRKYAFPLCDLEVVDKGSPDYQPMKDYAVWFANR